MNGRRREYPRPDLNRKWSARQIQGQGVPGSQNQLAGFRRVKTGRAECRQQGEMSWVGKGALGGHSTELQCDSPGTRWRSWAGA